MALRNIDTHSWGAMIAIALSSRKFDRRFLLSYLRTNPHIRDVLLGVGAAFDPYPKCYRPTFITDDHLAMLADWLAVGRDFQAGLKQLDTKVSKAGNSGEFRRRKSA